MKKLLIIAILFILFSVPVFTQDISPIVRDLSAILDGFGRESVPYLQQNALAGEGIGRAAMGESAKWYLAFSMGTVFSPGILTFVDEDNENFELLNVDGLIDQALEGASGSSTDISSLLESFSTTFYYPNFRLSFGIHLPLDLEVIGMFSIFPGALTTGIAGLLADTSPGLATLEFNRMNAGVRIRKVLIQDSKGIPALSVGTGYTFSNFHAGFSIPDDFTQDFATYSLELGGTLGMNTVLHTVGADFTISKKLLIFYPFFKVSAWYQWAEYTAGVTGFVAQFVDSGGNVLVEAETSPESLIQSRDLKVLLSGGFELALGKFSFVPNASFDIMSKSFMANLGMKLQF